MSRRYSDPIRVMVSPPADPVEPEPPQSFHWRGRRYRVTEVLARWTEAEQWWRWAEHGSDRFPADAMVWRVAASSRGTATGVFELRHRPGSAWFLIRAFD